MKGRGFRGFLGRSARHPWLRRLFVAWALGSGGVLGAVFQEGGHAPPPLALNTALTPAIHSGLAEALKT